MINISAEGSLLALINAIQRRRAIFWTGNVLVEFDDDCFVPQGPVTMVLDESDLAELFAVKDALLKGGTMDHYHGERDASLEQLGEHEQVLVAEDPVREAAKDVIARYDDLDFYGTRDAIARLREDLAQPAPPSLTEDERGVLLWGLDLLEMQDRDGRLASRTAERVRSAREKLSYKSQEEK